MRYEYKFKVDALKATLVRELLSFLGTPDHFNQGDSGYSVMSHYYDTFDFNYYFQKVNGFRRQQKIRLRKYNLHKSWQESNCVLEAKFKVAQSSFKNRLFLPQGDFFWPQLWREKLMLDIKSEMFISESSKHALIPVCQVSYQRLAYLIGCNGHNIRINLDYNINCQRDGFSKVTPLLDNGEVIMEIKCPTQQIPIELQNIFKHVNLKRITYSKYSESIDKLYKDKNERII